MTVQDYMQSGCDNFHSEFKFKDGNILSGVITSFFVSESTDYYFVKSNDLIEFKELMDKNDYERMKLFSQKIDLNTLISVRRLN